MTGTPFTESGQRPSDSRRARRPRQASTAAGGGILERPDGRGRLDQRRAMTREREPLERSVVRRVPSASQDPAVSRDGRDFTDPVGFLEGPRDHEMRRIGSRSTGGSPPRQVEVVRAEGLVQGGSIRLDSMVPTGSGGFGRFYVAFRLPGRLAFHSGERKVARPRASIS